MQRPDGSMVSKPLEDLFPFLDREEFRSNMIIPPLDD
jgi:acetolactate synthase I/II/III large subunit